MKELDFTIKKNILDLEHSEYLSKGTTEIGIGLGGFIAIYFSIVNQNFLIGIITALLFCLIFCVDGIKKLNCCKTKKKEIERLSLEFVSSNWKWQKNVLNARMIWIM